MSYLICLLTAAVIIALYVVFRSWVEKHISIVLKVLSGLLCVVFFIRYFGSKGSLLADVAAVGANNPFESGFVCAMASICVWLEIASITVTEIYPYFEHRPLMHNLSKTFCLISSVLNIVFLRWTAYTFTGSYSMDYVSAFMAVEVAIIFCMSLHTLWADKRFLVAKGQLKDYLVFLPVVLIVSLPPYTLQSLFGNMGYYFTTGFAFYHRLYLYIAVAVFIIMYMILRRHDREFVRMVLLYMSLAALVSFLYDYDFSRFAEPSLWPLHLCCAVLFVLPVVFMFRINWLYYFTLFIGVAGAVFAMFVPNTASELGALSPDVMRFWINHIAVFALPLLAVFTGVYERPKVRDFLYSLIVYAAYFLVINFVNAWFSALYETSVDFFFTNGTVIMSVLGAESLKNIVWTVTLGNLELTFMYAYQLIYLFAYAAFCAIWYGVLIWIFHAQDIYLNAEERYRDIKVEEYALCQQYGKKRPGDCMNEETKDKLVIKNFSKRYGRNTFYSTHDLDIEVPSGQICGFLGANGAGKSTTIKCVVGIQPPTAGTIEINGYDIAKQPAEAKAQIGYVPDHYALYENLTGREYINYVADLYGISKAERDARLDDLLEKLSMKDAIDARISSYSHGMKQKVAIMSALVHNPKLWILDEPLTGLDPNSVYEIKECMKDHAHQGNIVFFSTHLLDVAETVCDRVLIIKHGHIIAEVNIKDLKAQGETLEQFYLQVIEEHNEGHSPYPDEDGPRKKTPHAGGLFFNRPKKSRQDKEADATDAAEK
ncbi:MAG: YwaF family protein [Clostridia bacterium]|nr:YwaF family protein [Clostridia bacterium]